MGCGRFFTGPTRNKKPKRARCVPCDDYLAFCQQRGEKPNKPFSGQFVTRISPELHRQVRRQAFPAKASMPGSLNNFKRPSPVSG
ncbi:MAG: toxin-antitoxin system HicB family antitoxin [Planctomycetota bacterium]|nr:toxin-antitoxin system HicB family antitoxin [Planctomycetota bacterium]